MSGKNQGLLGQYPGSLGGGSATRKDPEIYDDPFLKHSQGRLTTEDVVRYAINQPLIIVAGPDTGRR